MSACFTPLAIHSTALRVAASNDAFTRRRGPDLPTSSLKMEKLLQAGVEQGSCSRAKRSGLSVSVRRRAFVLSFSVEPSKPHRTRTDYSQFLHVRVPWASARRFPVPHVPRQLQTRVEVSISASGIVL